MSSRLRAAVCAVVVLPMIAGHAVAQAPATFKKDQKVEVREGDVWSAGTVLEQEGRRVRVKYDDGSEEWVPLARVRTPTGAATAGGTSTAPPAAGKPAAAQPAKPAEEKTPLTGKCEIKWGGQWKPGTIKNRDGDLYLVIYDGWEDRMHWAWVSNDCVRAVGGKKAGPSFGRSVTVGLSGVEKAKADAKRELPTWKAEYAKDQEKQKEELAEAEQKAKSKDAGDRAEAAKARAEAMNGKPGSFDPAAYDKPIIVAKNTNVPAQTAKRTAANTYKPEAVAETASADPIKISRGTHFSGHFDEMIAAGPFAAAVQMQGKDLYTVQLLDLATGTVTDPLEFDPLSKPFALSTDGKVLIGRSDNFFGGTRLRLDVFDVTPGEIKHRVSFEPYATATNKRDRDVTFAALSNGLLVTCNEAGDLAGWTLSASGEPTVTCKWKSNVGGKGVAVSPNGKTIAIARADGLFLLDTATGATQAFIAATRESDRITFTPDGKWVVGIDGPTLLAYDLVAGEAAADVGLPPGVFGQAVVGVGPTHVLLDNAYLFDLERQAITWKYDDAANVIAAGGQAWARVGGRSPLLAPAKLPDATARRAAVSAAEPLFKAGDSISLDISIEADEKQQTAIREHFTKELGRIGVKVADGRPIRLVVRTENGKSTQERWATMGGAPWNRESADVTVTDKISSVTIEAEGKMAWQHMTTARVGGMVSSKEGKGIAESVQAANQFNLSFFRAVKLPAFVAKPRTPLTAGSTKWTAVGGT